MEQLKNKFYYKKNQKELCKILGMFCLLSIAFFFLIKVFELSINKNLLCTVVYAFSFIYYCQKERVIKKAEKNKVFCSTHCMGCIKAYHMCMIAHLICLVFSALLGVVNASESYLYIVLLAYIIVIGIALMNYNFIIIGQEDGFWSGEYFIKYDEVTNIVSLKKTVTRDGVLLACKLENNGTVMGYDKFLYDDYQHIIENMKLES